MNRCLTLISILFSSLSLNAQLILGGNTPQDLVQNVISGYGVTVSNVQYTGDLDAVSYFNKNSNVLNLSIENGLLMTTGSRYIALGPNNSINASIKHDLPGFSLLEQTLACPGFDAAIFEFDIISSGNILKITYQFASEEGPNDYQAPPQNYKYNDGFGIYIRGGQYPSDTNFALFQDNTPICIRNLWKPSSTNFLIHNGIGTNSPYNWSSEYIQYDELTIPITNQINITPGTTYHITLAIEDSGDGVLDSGVFIKAQSLTAGITENELTEKIKLFYNPTTGMTQIEANEITDQVNYTVVDISGKIIETGTFNTSIQIDMNDWHQGSYFVKLENSTNQFSYKIMVY